MKGQCLIVGSAYHNSTKVEQATCVIGDTLHTYANGCKDDWDRQLPLAVFAINNTASTLGDGLTPIFIDRGARPRLPLLTRHVWPARAPMSTRSRGCLARR